MIGSKHHFAVLHRHGLTLLTDLLVRDEPKTKFPKRTFGIYLSIYRFIYLLMIILFLFSKSLTPKLIYFILLFTFQMDTQAHKHLCNDICFTSACFTFPPLSFTVVLAVMSSSEKVCFLFASPCFFFLQLCKCNAVWTSIKQLTRL